MRTSVCARLRRGRRALGMSSTAAAASIGTLVPLSLFGGYCLGELAYVILRTPRLPEAPGPVKGRAQGAKESSRRDPLRILCLGDSVAAGCGLESNEGACAGIFARHAAKHFGLPVEWTVLARNGYTAKRIEEKHVKRIEAPYPELIILSVGVNNLLAMHSESQIETDLTSLLGAVRAKVGPTATIVVLGVPPMSMFVALTPLLRLLAGRKAKQFDRVMARVCGGGHGHQDEAGSSRLVHCDYQDLAVDLATKSGDQAGVFFAPDGFHPGPRALEMMANHLFEVRFQAEVVDLAKEDDADGGAGGRAVAFAKKK